jgi:hypothetical protein
VAELNWDILKDMLLALRGRQGTTTMAWVKAHSGDIGNELADHQAGMGCGMQEKLWDRETYPLELYGLETGDKVSPHGWNMEAGRKAGEYYGEWARERLRGTGQAVSTVSLVKDDRGREHLGYHLVRHDGRTTEYDRRVMMQARSECYPTEAYLARISGKDPREGRCKLCGAAVETYGHIQVVCCKLTDARRTAHNIVTEAVLSAIKEGNQELEVEAEKTVREWMGADGDRVPEDIAGFKPDAIILFKGEKRVVVWEFMRGMVDDEADFEQREELKRQAYHGVLVFLRHAFADHEVEFQSVVMGVRTSLRHRDFEGQLERLGLGEGKLQEVGRVAVEALIRANGYVLGKRLEMKARLGLG